MQSKYHNIHLSYGIGFTYDPVQARGATHSFLAPDFTGTLYMGMLGQHFKFEVDLFSYFGMLYGSFIVK